MYRVLPGSYFLVGFGCGMYYNVFVCQSFFGVRVAIDNNVVSVQYNGGLLPDIILLIQCSYYHYILGKNPFKCH